MKQKAGVEGFSSQSIIESGIYDKHGIFAILTVEGVIAGRFKCSVYVPEGVAQNGEIKEPFFLAPEEWKELKKIPPVGDIRINRNTSNGFIGVYQMKGYLMENGKPMISYIVTTPDETTVFGSEDISLWAEREQYYFLGEKLAGNVQTEVAQILSAK